MQDKKQQLEPDMKQRTGSKSGKEYNKAVYCHPANLTYMQSTSWKILGWMSHNRESRLLGETSTTSDMQMIYHSNSRKYEELKDLLIKVNEESEKDDLKFNIQKTKIKNTHVPHCSLQHCLQQPEHGSNLDAHQQMNG